MHQVAALGAGVALTCVVAALAWVRRARHADYHPAALGVVRVVSLFVLGIASVAGALAGSAALQVVWSVAAAISATALVGSQVAVATYLHQRWTHVALDAWLIAVAVMIPVVAFARMALDAGTPWTLLLALSVLVWSTAFTVLLVPYARVGRLTSTGVVVSTSAHTLAVAAVYLAGPTPPREPVTWAVALLVLGWSAMLLVAVQARGTGAEAPQAREVRHPDQAGSLAVFASAVVTTTLVSFYVDATAVPVLLLSLSCVVALVVRQMLISRQNERNAHQLASRERYFRSLVQDSTDMLVICSPDGVIEYVSSAVEEVLGLGPAAAVGRPVGALLDVDSARFRELSEQALAQDGPVKVDASTMSEQGELTLQATVTVQAGKVLFTIRDLTDRGRLREQLSYVASHDVATDLYNRRGINHMLLGALRMRPGRAAVLFIDLDGFKRVNDAAGHEVGDRLLKAVAERLRASTPAECVLGRYGGDEFVVVVPSREENDPRTLAETIVAAVKEPYVWSTHQFVLGASVGIALAEQGSEADGLIRYADMAMYEAKKARLGYTFFEPRMLSVVKEQARADFALTQAFDAGRMHLLYQPIVDLRTGATVKAEGLLRWIDVEGVEQRPLDLVEFTERTGRGQALSRWVIAEAVKQQVVWREHGHRVQIAINLSPHEFTDPALIVFLDQLIEDYGIPYGSLELEVTERVMIQDPSRAIDAMQAMKSRGIQVAIDDFGTGFSSLRYLLELPIDTLKLDQAFVRQVSTGQTAQSIVQGIVTIGRELDLVVVAEGIEAEEQRQLVADMGCDLGQGYLFSAELRSRELEELLDLQQQAS